MIVKREWQSIAIDARVSDLRFFINRAPAGSDERAYYEAYLAARLNQGEYPPPAKD